MEQTGKAIDEGIDAAKDTLEGAAEKADEGVDAAKMPSTRPKTG